MRNASPGTASTIAARTSARLSRAAAAELRGLERQRDRLVRRRERILASVEPVDRALAAIDARAELLKLLTGDRPGWSSHSSTAASVSPRDPRILAGSAIRETAAKALAASPVARGPIHYRELLQMLTDAGFRIHGEKPDAVFLTQLTRSPVIRKAGRPGEYELDHDAPARLRTRVGALQRELRDGAGEGACAATRRLTLKELDRAERALQEATRCLGALGRPAGALPARHHQPAPQVGRNATPLTVLAPGR
jgi:hypothetical protein